MFSKMIGTAARPCFLLLMSIVAISWGPNGSVTSIPAPANVGGRRTIPLQMDHEKDNSLEGALHYIQRARRNIGDEEPYSRTNRYRYPLQDKRTVYGVNWANNQGWPYLQRSMEGLRENDEENDMRENGPDYDDEHSGTSPFRERIQDRNPLIGLQHIRFPEHRRSVIKKAISFIPSYEPEDFSEITGDRRRKNERGMYPSPRKVHLDELLEDRDSSLGVPHYFPDEEDERFYLNALRNNDFHKENFLEKRHKRSAEVSEYPPIATGSFSDIADNSTTGNHDKITRGIGETSKAHEPRSKRAFRENGLRNYYGNHFEDEKERDDFLAREYFKALSRTVGDKRRRNGMSGEYHHQIKPDNFEMDLHPEEGKIIQALQSELRAAEEELSNEAERAVLVLSQGEYNNLEEMEGIQAALRDMLKRLEELHEAKNALEDLELLHERRILRKRAQDLLGDSKKRADLKKRFDERPYEGVSEEMKEAENDNKDEQENEGIDDNKKRKKKTEGELEHEEDYSKDSDDKKRKKIDKYQELKERKRKNDVISPFFGSNKKEECPVLEKVLMSCVMVSKMVHDNFLEFVEPCLRHEICYMCGSGMDVSQSECDSLLSSGMDDKCDIIYAEDSSKTDKMKCLHSASLEHKLLSDPDRFDSKGGCTFDPCIRELLDSR